MLQRIFIILTLALFGVLQANGAARALTAEQEAALVASVSAGTSRQAVGELLATTQPEAAQLPQQVCEATRVLTGAATGPGQQAELTLAATEAASAYMRDAGFPEAAVLPALITIQEQCVLPTAVENPDFARALLDTAGSRAQSRTSPESVEAALALFSAINTPAPSGQEEARAQLQALAQATGFQTIAQNLLVAVEPAAGPAAPAGGLAPAPAVPGPVGGGGGGGGRGVASPS